MKQYLKTKYSGIEWIGNVPEHWKINPLKKLADKKPFSIVDGPFGSDLKLTDYVDDGIIPVLTIEMLYDISRINQARKISLEKFEQIKRSRIIGGDIIIAKIGNTFGMNCIYPHDYPLAVIPANICKISIDKTDSEIGFVKYWMDSIRYNGYLTTIVSFTAQPAFSVKNFRNLKIATPPKNEQKQIVDFLDNVTTKIEYEIQKSKRLTASLKEKRQAVIHKAVTKGLDPTVPMKDSGMKLIGDIPKHWEIKRYKFVTSKIDVGIAEGTTHAYTDVGVPIIRSTNVKPNHIEFDDIIFIKDWFAIKNHSKILHSGNVVTVRTGYPGVSAVIPENLEGSQCFTLLISRLLPRQDPYFYSYYLNSDIAKEIFHMEGWGAAQINISVPILQNIIVVEPDMTEQKQIVDFLRNMTSKIDSIIQKTETQIEKLQEYCQSLIFSAVTGKIDVRQEVQYNDN